MKIFNVILLAALLCAIIVGIAVYRRSQVVVINSDRTLEDSSQKDFPEPTPLHRPELSTFYKAIQAADLGHIFKGTGHYTGFVPTNEAFEKLDKKKWAELQKPKNRDMLLDVLTYHMVTGKYKLEGLKTGQLKTLNGKNIDIQVSENGITVNKAKIVQGNLEGPNWYIHEIDTVLIPE